MSPPEPARSRSYRCAVQRVVIQEGCAGGVYVLGVEGSSAPNSYPQTGCRQGLAVAGSPPEGRARRSCFSPNV